MPSGRVHMHHYDGHILCSGNIQGSGFALATKAQGTRRPGPALVHLPHPPPPSLRFSRPPSCGTRRQLCRQRCTFYNSPDGAVRRDQHVRACDSQVDGISAFTNQFLGYDLLARRWVPYTHVYTFGETFSGICMLGLMIAGPRHLVVRSQLSSTVIYPDLQSIRAQEPIGRDDQVGRRRDVPHTRRAKSNFEPWHGQ